MNLLWGHMVLFKSNLEVILIYYHLMAHIPKGTLNIIHHVCFNFWWKGSNDYQGSHLEIWKDIATPKDLGGRGIKNITF